MFKWVEIQNPDNTFERVRQGTFELKHFPKDIEFKTLEKLEDFMLYMMFDSTPDINDSPHESLGYHSNLVWVRAPDDLANNRVNIRILVGEYVGSKSTSATRSDRFARHVQTGVETFNVCSPEDAAHARAWVTNYFKRLERQGNILLQLQEDA
jgi:hypothetical protein